MAKYFGNHAQEGGYIASIMLTIGSKDPRYGVLIMLTKYLPLNLQGLAVEGSRQGWSG